MITSALSGIVVTVVVFAAVVFDLIFCGKNKIGSISTESTPQKLHVDSSHCSV